MTKPIRRTSIAEATMNHIVERIRMGDFGPGDRLPSERDMQEQLGVGRLALREALARLSALGIIRVDHGKGAFIQKRPSSASVAGALIPCFPERDVKSMEDLIKARALIESELAALAAERRTEEDIALLSGILDEAGQAMDHNSTLAELDYKFHLEIARIADNDFLAVMLKALGSHIRRFLHYYVEALGNPRLAIKRHKPILQAIIDKNPQLARELARAHVGIALANVEAFMEDQAKRA
ncbi:FadR/GntR family transcriptional regulator [Planctomycetota bacterium]